MREVRSANVECRSADRVAESIRRRVERWTAKYRPEWVSAVLATKAEGMRERYELQAGFPRKDDEPQRGQ